jgi:gas vesicle protein
MQKRILIMNKNSAFGLMVGFGLGVGLAVLFAPKSGDKTRLLTARRATELRDSATDIIDRGQEEVTRHAQGLRRAVEIGRRAYIRSVG